MQSAARLPSLAPHDSKARLRPVTTRRGAWRSHVHRTHTAQRVQSFELHAANVKPFFWTGTARFLSSERKWGGIRAAPPALPPRGTTPQKTFAPVRKSGGHSLTQENGPLYPHSRAVREFRAGVISCPVVSRANTAPLRPLPRRRRGPCPRSSCSTLPCSAGRHRRTSCPF